MARVNLVQATADTLLNNWFPVGPDTIPRFVVVCDVGQGNCNVVFNDEWRPFIYYDMGGGMNGSQFTYPHPAPTFCLDVNYSLFIQSHWDEDHYRSMSEQIGLGNLNNLVCLAPSQDSGATAWRQAIAASAAGHGMKTYVANAGTLNCWPDENHANAPAMAHSTYSHFRVFKVSGKDTNNSGLALRLQEPGGANQFMLLTGDCTFERHRAQNTAPHGCDGTCVGMVAGHHGAAVGHAAYIPRPAAGQPVLLAYSFGWGNEYGHPNGNRGAAAYEGRGWDDDHRMDTGGAEVTARFAGPRGNVGLVWPGAALGPCSVAPGANALAINRAAVSLLAATSAEVELYEGGLANGDAVAVGAAFQAAHEARVPAVAAALSVPAVQAPAQTLAQVANTMALAGGGAVHATVTAALNVAVATANAANHPNAQEMARAAVECVMVAAAKVAQEVSGWVRTMVDGLLAEDPGLGLPSQARYAAAEAYGCANHATTRRAAGEAIPADFLQEFRTAVHARGAANVPTTDALRDAVSTAVAAAAQALIGQTGGLSQAHQPPAAAAVAALQLGGLRDDIRAALSAAAALVPAIAINPHAGRPATLTNNENAKLLPRIGAIAAIVGTPSGHIDQVASAAVAAARVALAAASGAPQVGCHRIPRTCPNGPCSLSVHYFQGMFPANVITFAGDGNNANTGDGGRAPAARFTTPSHVTQDNNWNLYVSDGGNHRVRKVNSTGLITALAGDGNQGYQGDSAAQATAASLRQATALAVAPGRNLLFIADAVSHRVRQVDLSTGIISALAGNGTQGFAGDGGPATAAHLNAPMGLAFDDHDGLLYISDSGNHCVRAVALATGRIQTVVGVGGVAGNTGDDGPPTAANLRTPRGICMDGGGNLYIADSGNHRVRWSTVGGLKAFAGTGTQGFLGDGAAAENARLNAPTGVAVDDNGIVYIADSGNRRIRVVDGGDIDTFAGTGHAGNNGDGGAATAARLDAPVAVAVNGTSVYIVDQNQHRVRVVDTNTGNIAAYAGSGTAGFQGDGGGAAAGRLQGPLAITPGSGAVFIADGGNHRVRKVAAGTLSTVAGDGTNASTGDSNTLALNARLHTPMGTAYDPKHNILFIADSGNHRVRKVELTTGLISLVAGNGTAGFQGDNGLATAARLHTPTDVGFDSETQVLYICDRGNHRIRKVELATGRISTYAGDGTGAFGGDGGAANAAQLHDPIALAVADSGDVFVATVGDHRVRSIELDTGDITTVAGTGVQGMTGDNGNATLARLDTPSGLSVDNAGVLYISCSGSHRVRKVQDGTISTVAGSGANGFAGDGGQPTAANISAPRGIAVDLAGRNLFIADTGNRRVRRACL
ncbi:NHL domain-containing protein [Pyxidicoccus xibeiensis]|uniref:NHL domain-containing protein n=1 Tax=Pyxidicoccus xibeiensis TaxID=2906759 RepID=UPI0020A7186F|nr:hypothetical protein [Pyxidicoccus xibeiensis]MCP3135802.1 hypothetical protein [Pyxidicoccus xibeiensis]